MRIRFHLLFALVALGFTGVLSRLAYIQVWRHGEFVRRVARQASRSIPEAPRRARIVDRNGAVLAESVRVASCYADPKTLRHARESARRLAPVLGLSPEALHQKIGQTPGAFVWLKRFIPAEQAAAVEALNLKGVGLVWEYRRFYPNGDLASPILGVVGEDGRGLSGLEYAFNDDLLDLRPPKRALRDGRGARLALSQEPDRGAAGELRLTLDRTLQYIAERELDNGIKRSRARAGLVLVQDPHTGEILAMASRPSVSFSSVKKPTPEHLQILGAQWVFEPGSTFKLVTAAAALEEARVRPADLLDCESGKWKYSGITINDHEPEKVISFARAMAVSSNIGLSKVGLRLGKEKMYDYMRAFGFGARAGFEIPGEGAGLLRPLRGWSGVSLPVISFGQEVGVTALQLAGAYSAVANGGQVMEPRLCALLRRPDGRERRWPSGAVVRRVISPGTAAQLTALLKGVVEGGTGTEAALPGWTAAGKTGTAQKIDPRLRRYSHDKFVASFCGFAPADKPRLTIVVILDEPTGLAWGGYNAGPVFRNVAWHALAKLGVPPDQPINLAQKRKKDGAL